MYTLNYMIFKTCKYQKLLLKGKQLTVDEICIKQDKDFMFFMQIIHTTWHEKGKELKNIKTS